MPKIATTARVDRAALLEFLRPRHRAVLMTRRAGGGAKLSPVTCGVDGEGRIVVDLPATGQGSQRPSGAERVDLRPVR